MRQSARRQAGTTCNPQSAFLTDADAWRLALFDSGATRLLDPSRQPSTNCAVPKVSVQSSHPSSDASPGNSLDSGNRGISDPRSSPRPRKSDRLPPFAGPVFPRRSVPLSAWAFLEKCRMAALYFFARSLSFHAVPYFMEAQ